MKKTLEIKEIPSLSVILEQAQKQNGNAWDIEQELGIGIAQTRSLLRECCDRGWLIPTIDEDVYTLTQLGQENLVPSTDFLSNSTQKTLEVLENEIKSISHSATLAFYEHGCRLREIRDRQLYLNRNYKNFDFYCKTESANIGFTPRHAYRIMAATDVYEIVKDYCPSGSGINERMMRSLVEVEEKDRLTVWKMALTLASDEEKPLSGAIVKKAKQIWEERQIDPNNLEAIALDTICKVELSALNDDFNLKRLNKQLVKVVEAFEHSYAVVSFGNLPVKEYLKREELIPIDDEYRAKLSFSVSLENLLKLWELGYGAIEDAIAHLLEMEAAQNVAETRSMIEEINRAA